MKKTNGITLIALVITIIVLLVLAGVSLSLIAGGDGILSKAENAVNASQKASIQEEIELLISEAKMAYYTDNEADTVTIDEFVGNYLNNNPTSSGAKITYIGGEISYKKDGQIYTTEIDMNTGKIGEIASGTEELTEQAYNSRHPELHIPTGFSYKEGSVSTGYVIHDNEENEFVWIPVANDTIYAKKLRKGWYLTENSIGDDIIDNLQQAIKGDVLGIDNILGTNVRSTLDANQPEYAVVKKAGGFWVGRYEAGIESEEHSDIAGLNAWTLDEESSNKSNTYWESKKNSIKVAQNMEPVRSITQIKALEIANSWKNGSTNENADTVAFQSGLITGSQWDAMCKFIGWDICDTSCLEWGNYANIAGANYTGYHSSDNSNDWLNEQEVIKKDDNTNRWIFPTGKFVNENNGTTVKKNIYDIAGNVLEWTTEIPQYNIDNGVIRGGCAFNNGKIGNVAAGRSGDHDKIRADWCTGFRIVLYVE